MQTPQDFYYLRISELTTSLANTNKIIRNISIARLFSFLLIIFSVYIYTTYHPFLATTLLLIFITAFILLVKSSIKYSEQKKLLEKLLTINKDEIEFLKFNYLHFPDGSEFINYLHPYSSDLNIFGKASLFQFLNRAETELGKFELAEILTNYEPQPEIITNRQQAVKEITSKAEWRQQFQAKANFCEIHDKALETLNTWLSEPSSFFKNKILKILIIILPFCTVSLFIYGLFSKIYGFAEIAFFFQILLYFSKAKEINQIHDKLSRKHEILKGFSGLLEEIEKEEFQSEILKQSKNILVENQGSAAKQIKILSKIVNRFDLRLNILVTSILNILYLADFWNVLQIEKWKKANKNQLENWMKSIAVFECFSSIGNYTFNHPNYCFPEIAHLKFEFHAINVGHPLIPDEKRVCNNFSLENQGNFIVLTGANMAGKSTFLRTIGINMVLAMTGAPVCASHFRFYPIPIMSGISVKDSLHDNESYFYAELKRLKMIVDELESGKSIFIFLDEMLKGTNSNDKIKGSKAILEKFITYKAVGIIATHDISLGDLEATYPHNIKNYSFEVFLENDKLYYDYKLHEGTCKNLNASYLMKKMGIIS